MIFLVIFMLFIIYIFYDKEDDNNFIYYGSPGIVREGMGTLRPQTSYTSNGCYPYERSPHLPTGASQSRIIFNYWANKMISKQIQDDITEWNKSKQHPVSHDICQQYV